MQPQILTYKSRFPSHILEVFLFTFFQSDGGHLIDSIYLIESSYTRDGLISKNIRYLFSKYVKVGLILPIFVRSHQV